MGFERLVSLLFLAQALLPLFGDLLQGFFVLLEAFDEGFGLLVSPMQIAEASLHRVEFFQRRVPLLQGKLHLVAFTGFQRVFVWREVIMIMMMMIMTMMMMMMMMMITMMMISPADTEDYRKERLQRRWRMPISTLMWSH